MLKAYQLRKDDAMKRNVLIILFLGLLLLLCACFPQGATPAENEKDAYTYEQEKQINDSIEATMSEYGFDYTIFAREDDGKIVISINLKRTLEGAEDVFVDTIEWSLAAAKTAKEQTPFELGELSVTFILYEGALDGDAAGTMRYTSSTLEKGNVFCTYPNMVIKKKDDATLDEIRLYLTGRPAQASEELLEAASIYQGEWERSKYGKAVISADTVNFVHEMEISGKHTVSINTFYFAFSPDGTLVINNQHGQARYNISLLEDGRMQIQNFGGDDEPDIYEKISDSTIVPEEKGDPKIGMTEQEVCASSWGYPKKQNTTTTANGTRVQWVYDFGYIYFTNGVVTAIQEK